MQNNSWDNILKKTYKDLYYYDFGTGKKVPNEKPQIVQNTTNMQTKSKTIPTKETKDFSMYQQILEYAKDIFSK